MSSMVPTLLPECLPSSRVGVIDGYPGSTWAGLMRAQAPRVAVGGR